MSARHASQSLVPWLASLTLVAGCTSGQPSPTAIPAAGANTPHVAPAATPEVAAPAQPLAGRVLTGEAFFNAGVTGGFTVEAFALGDPAKAIASGSGIIAAGSGNVIAPGGGNIIAPGGGNYRTAATVQAPGSFQLALPDALASGSFVKLVLKSGDQVLVLVAAVPEKQETRKKVVATSSTTLAYVLLRPRLEGAGQSLFTGKGALVPGLAQAVVKAYEALAKETAAAFDDQADALRREKVEKAMAKAAKGDQALDDDAVAQLLGLAPGVRAAFIQSVGDLEAGIQAALKLGARTPDAIYLGVFRLGNSVNVRPLFGRGRPDIPPAENTTGVEVQDGRVDQPTGGPVVTSSAAN